MATWDVILDIVLLLIGALFFGGLFARFRQSAVVGYLFAGMLLGGPGSVQVIQFSGDVEAVAELGVTLLLFSLGLEFSWSRLRSLGVAVLLGGILQVSLTCLAATLVGLLFGLQLTEATAIGAMVSLSSTACVLRVFVERSDLESVHGRDSLGILLVQDILVVPLAILIAVLGSGGTAWSITLELSQTIAMAAAFVGILYLVLNVIAVRLLGKLTLERNRELSVLMAVATVLGASWAAHRVGLSPALGAFMAGIFLGSSPFSMQIRADISSLRVVLLTLFFGAVGMVANPLWMLANWRLVLGITLILMFGKATIVWFILRILGRSDGTAIATGLSISQIGEFAFVIGSIAKSNGLVEQEIYLAVVSSAILSLILTPFVIPLAPHLAGRINSLFIGRNRRRLGNAADADADVPKVAIIGFGPAGEAVGRELNRRQISAWVLDLNVDAIRRARELGLQCYVGDATHVDVLEHLQIKSANLVIITVPAIPTALAVLRHVRALAPYAHVVVRTRYQRHTAHFTSAGAGAVIGDEQQVGQALAIHVSEHLDS